MEAKKRTKRATAYRVVRRIEACNRDGCKYPVSTAWIEAMSNGWVANNGVTYDDWHAIARTAGYNVRRKKGIYYEYVLNGAE